MMEHGTQVEPYIRDGMAASLTVALVSPVCEVGDKERNLETYVECIAEAAHKGADIVAFPETALTGYQLGEPGCATPLYDAVETIPGPSIQKLEAAARAHDIHIVMGMYEADSDFIGRIYNSAALIGPHGLIGKYRKSTIESFTTCGDFDMHKWGVGHGDEVFVWEIRTGWRIGIIICYDLWVPELARVAVLKGADLVLVIAAIADPAVTTMLVPVRALENLTGVALCNHYGVQKGVSLPGGRIAAEAGGEVILPLDVENRGQGSDIVRFSARKLYEARKNQTQLRDRTPRAYETLVKSTEATLDFIRYRSPVD